jgi:hypothetical protein
MKPAPDRAYVRNAVDSAEKSALSITRVELCHVLKELRRTLGAEGPERFVGSFFGLEGTSLPDLTADRSAGTGPLYYMPLVSAISDGALGELPIYDGWKWWAMYVRWSLFVGPDRPGEEVSNRYRSIINNHEVLKDAGIEDPVIQTGIYRFQVDFDPDEEWIDEMALCLLCDDSAKTVAEVCARDDIETCKSEYHRSVIRVGAVREYLSTHSEFVPTTFLGPDDERIKALINTT